MSEANSITWRACRTVAFLWPKNQVCAVLFPFHMISGKDNISASQVGQYQLSVIVVELKQLWDRCRKMQVQTGSMEERTPKKWKKKIQSSRLSTDIGFGERRVILKTYILRLVPRITKSLAAFGLPSGNRPLSRSRGMETTV